MIVNYNKTEFNQAQYGPYPAQIGGVQGISGRVNDETVPVKMLVPTHPVFNFPNKIGPSAWDNWMQERGQYFLGQKDPKYVDLISMTDSFPDNPGEKLGGARRSEVRQGPLDLSRPRALASAARRHGRRVSAAGESAEPAEGAGPARGEVGPERRPRLYLPRSDRPAVLAFQHTMRIGVPKEIHDGERRVATTPDVAGQLQKLGFTVAIEAGAGERRRSRRRVSRGRRDGRRRHARAVVVERHHSQSPRARASSRPRRQRSRSAPPGPDADRVSVARRRIRSCSSGSPAKGVTALAMDSIPRISRAQKMDALSSMANIARLSRGHRGGGTLRTVLHRTDHRRRPDSAGEGARHRRRRRGPVRDRHRATVSAPSCAPSTRARR